MLKLEFEFPVFIADAEVTLHFGARLLALVKGLEDVDGLGEVAAAEKLEDVAGEGLLIRNAGV